MKQYHELFNSCRIPNNGLDLFHSNPKIYGDQNDYIIVMAKDQMYKLKLTTSNGERVSLKELKRYLFFNALNSQLNSCFIFLELCYKWVMIVYQLPLNLQLVYLPLEIEILGQQ